MGLGPEFVKQDAWRERRPSIGVISSGSGRQQGRPGPPGPAEPPMGPARPSTGSAKLGRAGSGPLTSVSSPQFEPEASNFFELRASRAPIRPKFRATPALEFRPAAREPWPSRGTEASLFVFPSSSGAILADSRPTPAKDCRFHEDRPPLGGAPQRLHVVTLDLPFGRAIPGAVEVAGARSVVSQHYLHAGESGPKNMLGRGHRR